MNSDSMVQGALGNPVYRWTTGVEFTTGSLGQGVAGSVGMAWASKCYQDLFNRVNFELLIFDVYALAGDGGLQRVSQQKQPRWQSSGS